MIYEVIFDKQAVRKLDFFEYLLTQKNGVFSIHQLSKTFNYSHSTMLNICQEINEELKSLDLPAILTESNKVTWCAKEYSHSLYFQLLMRKSLPYRFIATTLLKPEVTFEQFCNEHYVSRATITRKMKRFIDHVKIYGVKISVSQMKLIGPESLIRMIYISFLWAGSHGEELFSHFGASFTIEKKLLATIKLADTQYMNPKESLLFFAVSKIRYLQGHLLKESPIDYLVLPETESSVKQYLTDFISETAEREHHLRFIGYMIFYAPYYINKHDERLPYILEYYTLAVKKQEPVALLLSELLSGLAENATYLPQEPEEKELLKLNLFTTLLNFSIHQGPVPLLLYSWSKNAAFNHVVYKELKQPIDKFLNKVKRREQFKWISNYQNLLAELLVLNIMPYLEKAYKTDKLNIAIVPTSNHKLVTELERFLSQLDFVDINYRSAVDDRIDFYISTFKKLLPTEEKPFFIIPLTESISYHTDLFDNLWKTYQEKLNEHLTKKASP